MASTFFGIETAKRGIVASQTKIYTTGHNISNAETEGYSRQRVNAHTTIPYEVSGSHLSIGTGVSAESIQRMRDEFADIQYRDQNNNVGYYTALNDSYLKLEEIMNEPSNSGLQATMDKFWNSLQTLSLNSEDSSARDVVVSTGQMVADTFNYYYNSLVGTKDDIGGQIDVNVAEINQLLQNINDLNRKISDVEPLGFVPNDLYDSRDVLVDKLSAKVNIKVTTVIPEKYGNVSALAEGIYQIELVKDDGSAFANPVELVSVEPLRGRSEANTLQLVNNNPQGYITGVYIGPETATPTETLDITSFMKSGELAGLIESYGYGVDDGTGTGTLTEKGLYPDMVEDLNKLVAAFANEFNAIHRQGYALNDPNPSGLNFFVFGNDKTNTNYSYEGNASQLIRINEEIAITSSKLAAGLGNGNSGNNETVKLLANLRTKPFSAYETFTAPNGPITEGLEGNIDSFYAGVIGSMAVEASSVEATLGNSETILASVDERRKSSSSVSLDEEMTDLVAFQHAYNANSRMITVMDEMLDRMINGMGRVGL